MDNAPLSPVENPIHKLQAELREFAKDRDWEQFHSPKNLAMALTVKVRRGVNKATVALANKMARQLWAQLAYG